MGAFVIDKPKLDGELGHRPQDHRSKLASLMDPHAHLHKSHSAHLPGEKHVLTEEFQRVLVASGIGLDAGVIQRHAEHWSSKRVKISEQVTRSEANRYLREGRRAMKRGDLNEAVYLLKQAIEKQRQVDQVRLSARTTTKDEADAQNARTDDLYKKGILDRDQAEHLKGGISESLEQELEKAITARDKRDFIIVEDMIKQQKAGKSALDKKHEEVKQPGRMTSAPKVPAPSSCFSRDEVHRIQDIFVAVSQDGIMGPAEWTRCLRFAGIENEVIALRLFELFDTSGDLQLNAKEFTCGLSEICNGYRPGKAVEEVRREFAFRFYDVDGEGHFDKRECCAHLKSYRLAAIRAIDRRISEFCTSIFGLVERDLTDEVELKMTKPTKQLDADLSDFVEDIFALFGDDKAERMSWDHFNRFTLKAPMVVEWLTNLGNTLKESFHKMDTSLNFQDAAPISDPGSVISDERLLSAFTRFAGEGGDNALIDEDEFVELMLKELNASNSRLGQLLFRAFDDAGNGGVTRSEFVSRWKLLTNDDMQPKLPMLFSLFDVKAQGYIDKTALRVFFLSFFDTAIESVQVLRKNLDQWVNGNTDPDSKGSKGIPNHFFVGASRKKSFSSRTTC
jgi:Ca2+-binding EF-hand superfamily protein